MVIQFLLDGFVVLEDRGVGSPLEFEDLYDLQQLLAAFDELGEHLLGYFDVGG